MPGTSCYDPDLFLGSIEPAGIAVAFEPFTVGIPPLAFLAIWLPATLVIINRNVARGARWILLGVATVLTLLIPALPAMQHARPLLTNDPQLLPWVTLLDASLGTLHLYLPALAAWAAIATLLIPARDRRATDPAPWYLLFGVLAGLTLYPRIDTAHVVIASPPILVLGAWALARAQSSVRYAGTWRSWGVVLTLLILPIGALAPQLMLRYATFIAPEDPGEPQDYRPLGLPRAPVLVPPQLGADTRLLVDYVQAGTPPGAPLFAYPAAPLFNFLAARPNPTRFDHFLPGTLAEQDLAEVIASLRHARPRYVIWDHAGVLLFNTDRANRALSDYLWRCYHEVTAFHLYLVLERRDDGC
ncbi:MAG: hypothetical protein LC797_20385 [Chloroflexi bacterium]|nr:hypothetical protein [Chloroflexota bacterium]